MYKCIKLLISVTQMYGAETKASKKIIAHIAESQNTMCHAMSKFLRIKYSV